MRTPGRICEFHNLYYAAEHDRFFVVVGPTSVFAGVPNPASPTAALDDPAAWTVDLSSLPGHPAFRFDADHVSPEHWTHARVRPAR